MPLDRNAVTLSFCQAARSSATAMASLLSNFMAEEIGQAAGRILYDRAAMRPPAYCRFAADAASGVELLSARFYGHVYDRHFHDGYAVGLTDAGAQAFRARVARHVSTPGAVIAFAPAEAHDGEAGGAARFAYRMPYLPESLGRAQL